MVFKGAGESTLVLDSPVPLMHHDPDRSHFAIGDSYERKLKSSLRSRSQFKESLSGFIR